ncbi:MAG: heme-binding protein, partial [Gemmatimonadetes bacterium]|nr:heme-binding protein [Gemmatimonadota bacterium]
MNAPARRAARLVLRPIGVLAALAACHTASGPTRALEPTAASSPARALVAESVPAFTPRVVRLSPDSAVRLSREGRAAVSAEVAPGLELSLWAPETMVADPIGVTFDERGRMFVTSTRRSKRGEIDIRQHPDWMIESITFKDIEDKRAFYKRVLAPENSAQNGWQVDWNKDGSHDWRDLTVNKEAVYRLEDTDGDGIADVSQLVLEDFHDVVSDVAQGVLSYKNDLYVTLAPDL